MVFRIPVRGILLSAFAKAFLDHGAHVIIADIAGPEGRGRIRAFDMNSWTCATMLRLKHLLCEFHS
jgi:hypothetical protein